MCLALAKVFSHKVKLRAVQSSGLDPKGYIKATLAPEIRFNVISLQF